GYYLVNQADDGNLVLYRTRDNTAVWAADTAGSTGNPKTVTMQADGNLVVYLAGRADPAGSVFSTQTSGRDGQGICLKVQDDGNLVLYRPPGATPDRSIWDRCGNTGNTSGTNLVSCN